MSSLVVGLRDCTIALLTSSIPDLEFQAAISHGDRLNLEIHANGWRVVLFELLIA